MRGSRAGPAAWGGARRLGAGRARGAAAARAAGATLRRGGSSRRALRWHGGPGRAQGATSAAAAPLALGGGVAEVAARGLGWVVVGGSVFRAAPQLLRILRHRSAEGVALSSFAIEFLAYTVTAAYNLRRGFPFSTYGEIWFCWAQTIALVGCVMHFQRTPRGQAAALTVALAAWAAMLLGGVVPLAAVVALQAAAPVGVALGRVPQIALNIRNGHTGQLSLGMCVLNAAGTGIRIFTTLTLTGDLLLLAGFALVFAVNGVLVTQCLQTRMKLARGELHLDPPATGGA